MFGKRLRLIPAIGLLATSGGALAQGWQADLELGAELRHFNHESPQAEQKDWTGSVVFEGELTRDWLGGNLRATIKPFARADSADSERSHADLREAHLLYLNGSWELLAGVNKVFWGALESAHLVDIINQTDGVENIDGEDKLGQPMVRVAHYFPFGTAEAYVMSGFRDRTFPGQDGRLRTEIPVDTNNPEFQSKNGRETLEYALRFSGNVGSLDYGISYFNGNSRDPKLNFQPLVGQQGQVIGGTLVPFYEDIEQVSIDALWALGGWLLKAESFYRDDTEGGFSALGVGAEYTLVGVIGNIDIGLLGEYLYDGRDVQPVLTQRDVFAATRIVFNDQAGTEVLAGVIRDLDDKSYIGLVEASRRLSGRAEIALELRFLSGFDNDQNLDFVQKDDFGQLEVRWYF